MIQGRGGGGKRQDLTPAFDPGFPVLKPVFTTIEQGLVVRTMGTLSVNDLRTLREVVAQVIG